LEVFTFEEAAHLDLRRPQNTEQAQYSLPYPLAAAVLLGGLDPAHVQPPYLDDKRILQLAEKVAIQVDPALDARFPAEALARVRLSTTDGRTLETSATAAAGGAENPMSDERITEKFRAAVSGSFAEQRAHAIQRACWECTQLASINELVSLLADPI
jgi:2-methylcitrate dehydratase PrpD